jgi:hypothetical protein
MKEKYVCPDKTVLEGVVHPNRARSVEGEHRVLRRKEVRGQAHLCVAGLVGQGGGMRERDNTLRAIHPTRPHTVGYIGVCDQGGDRLTQNAMSEGDTWPTSFPACPLGPLGSSSSQHRRTLELILQEGSAVFSSIKPKVRNRTQSAAKRMQRLSTIALWRHPAWRASASRLAVERIWLTYNIQDQNLVLVQNLGRVNHFKRFKLFPFRPRTSLNDSPPKIYLRPRIGRIGSPPCLGDAQW